jgi:hypothetical protein
MASSRLAVSRIVFLICVFECVAEREDHSCNLKEVKKLQVSGPDPKGTQLTRFFVAAGERIRKIAANNLVS